MGESALTTLQDAIRAVKNGTYSGDLPPEASTVGGGAPEGGLAEDIAKAKQYYRDTRGYVEGIDYTTGAGLGARLGFSRMETPEEQAGWLEKNAGENNFGQDPGGRWVLTPEGADKLGIKHKGMPVAIDPPALDWGDVAHWAGAEGPATAAGIAAGIATGGLGTVPAMLAAGGAAAGAKFTDEAVKSAQGYLKQDAGDVASRALTEGALSSAGEGAVRLARPVGRLFLGPHRDPEQMLNPFVPFKKPGSTFNPIYPRAPIESTLDPARLEAAKNAREAGFLVSPTNIMGKKGFLWPRTESAVRWLFGDPTEETNRAAALAGRERLQAEAANSPYTGGTAAGDAAEKVVLGKLDELSGNVTALKTEADQIAASSLDRVSRLTGPQIGGEAAGEATKQAIKDAKDSFSSAMSAKYAAWTQENAGREFPTSGIKQVAQDWLDSFPGKTVTESIDTGRLDASGKPITRETSSNQAAMALSPDGSKRIQSLIDNVGDSMTAEQMQNLRMFLREAAYDPNVLMPGVPKRIMKSLLRATDDALSDTGLASLNAEYKAGISKFDDARVIRMVRDPGMAGSLDADQIAGYVIAPGKLGLVRKVKEIVGPERWAEIRRANFDSMVGDLAGPDGTISATGLDNRINRLGMVLDETYGKDTADQIRGLSKQLLAKDGRIPLDGLSGDIVDALKRQNAAIDAQQSYIKNNLVRYVSSPDYEPGKVVSIMMQKDNDRFVASAKEALGGEGSPEWDKVKAEFAGRMLDSMIDKSGEFGDWLTPHIVDVGLRKQIETVSQRSVDNVLGQDFGKKLLDFSNMLSVSLRRQKIGAGALQVAAIALHPTRHVGRIVEFGIIRSLLKDPGFIKWMTEGYSADGVRIVADNVARASAHLFPRIGTFAQGAAGSAEDALGGVPGLSEDNK